MAATMPFGITEDDLRRFQEKQSDSSPTNHPIRNTETTTFFQAIMSDEADFLKQGFVSEKCVKLLGSDKDGE